MQSDHVNNVFKNSDIILAQKQPRNLIRLLCKTSINTDTNDFIKPKGLLKCTYNCC